jgi:hypothetical protein
MFPNSQKKIVGKTLQESATFEGSLDWVSNILINFLMLEIFV